MVRSKQVTPQLPDTRIRAEPEGRVGVTLGRLGIFPWDLGSVAFWTRHFAIALWRDVTSALAGSSACPSECLYTYLYVPYAHIPANRGLDPESVKILGRIHLSASGFAEVACAGAI